MTRLAYDMRPCPNCGRAATADFVDNGVGMQQVGPFGCEHCGWVEIKADDKFAMNDENEMFPVQE